MNFLLIGNSNIAEKRVIPALQSIGINQIDVASLSKYQSVVIPEGIKGKIFNDYTTALAESSADIVYISTINSSHAQLIQDALEHNFHVIVDKPAFINTVDAHRLIDLAQKKKCCLTEANVYGYHPQIQAVKEVFENANSQPTCLNVTFSFPPIDQYNFRYRKKFDGGALLDLGAYAISPGRIFFGDEPEEIFSYIRESNNEVETAFSMMATYKNGRSMVGHFGFNTGYRNRIDLLGPGVSITIDRVFTPPADMDISFEVNVNNQIRSLNIVANDTFALFLTKVIQSIEQNQLEAFTDDMLYDITVLDKLIKVTHQGRGKN